jgi:hypothetical protein
MVAREILKPMTHARAVSLLRDSDKKTNYTGCDSVRSAGNLDVLRNWELE